jgi:hypothetical protein
MIDIEITVNYDNIYDSCINHANIDKKAPITADYALTLRLKSFGSVI